MKSIYMASGNGVPDPNKTGRQIPPEPKPSDKPKDK